MKTKIWLIAAVVLILIGGIILGGMTMLKGDSENFLTSKYETNTHILSKPFENISVQTDTADITFERAEDGNCKVVCYERKKTKHSVSVKGDTLVIELIDERSWYDYISFNFKTPKITIYLPNEQYGSLSVIDDTGDVEMTNGICFDCADISLDTGDVDFSAIASGLVKLKTDTGSICVENTTAGALELSTSTGSITVTDTKCTNDSDFRLSTGKIKAHNLECKTLTLESDTGDIALSHVLVSEKLRAKTDTGDIRLDSTDAGEIFVQTDTGDVDGSLLSEKIFITQTDTGSVKVPKCTTGGLCEIITDTGDIMITIA